MDKSDWELIVVLSEGDEDHPPSHPLEEWEEFWEMRNHLEHLEDCHKGNYDDLRIIYKWKSLGFGAMKKWYELQGRYTDPKKIVLYGTKKV